MSESARVPVPAAKAAGSDPIDRPAVAGRRALNMMFGAQQLIFDEAIFASNELMDRTLTETHLLAEFVSKLAGSHSVRDLGTMYRECGQHQIDLIRRDCDRFFRHSTRAIEAALGLLDDRSSPIRIVTDAATETHKKNEP